MDGIYLWVIRMYSSLIIRRIVSIPLMVMGFFAVVLMSLFSILALLIWRVRAIEEPIKIDNEIYGDWDNPYM